MAKRQGLRRVKRIKRALIKRRKGWMRTTFLVIFAGTAGSAGPPEPTGMAGIVGMAGVVGLVGRVRRTKRGDYKFILYMRGLD